MSHTRKSDQTVCAFSLPVDMKDAALRRANDLGMTTSGFYRYCLAKELGYGSEAAEEASKHRGLVQILKQQKEKASRPKIHGLPANLAPGAVAQVGKAKTSAGIPAPKSSPSHSVDAPSEHKPERVPRTRSRSSSPPAPPKPAPTSPG
jgi:hypothetical protein